MADLPVDSFKIVAGNFNCKAEPLPYFMRTPLVMKTKPAPSLVLHSLLLIDGLLLCYS